MTALEFNNQVTEMRGLLLLFTRRFTTDQDEQNDLVQETMLKALLNRSKFRPNTNLKAWLYTIMRNTFINQIKRSSNRYTTNDQTEDQYLLNNVGRQDQSPVEGYTSYNEIKAQILELEEAYKRPLLMHADGYKYKEIADELGLPIGTVKSRIFFARKRLAATLQGYQN